MRIKEVSYSQLFSFGRFQNEEIGYTAEINGDENPDQVLGELRQKAVLQHHMNQQARQTREDLEHIEIIEEDGNDSLGVLRNKLSTVRNRIREQEYTFYRLDHIEEAINRIEKEWKELIARKEEVLEELSE